MFSQQRRRLEVGDSKKKRKNSKIRNLFRWERREVSDRREHEVPAHAFLFPSGISTQSRLETFSHSRAAIMRHTECVAVQVEEKAIKLVVIAGDHLDTSS